MDYQDRQPIGPVTAKVGGGSHVGLTTMASSPDDLVFPHHDGSWIPRNWFARRFDKACATTGLNDVTPHTLRHTAGSLALASGASVVTVQKLLGHQSPITTVNVHAHQHLAAAMDSAAQAAALVASTSAGGCASQGQ